MYHWLNALCYLNKILEDGENEKNIQPHAVLLGPHYLGSYIPGPLNQQPRHNSVLCYSGYTHPQAVILHDTLSIRHKGISYLSTCSLRSILFLPSSLPHSLWIEYIHIFAFSTSVPSWSLLCKRKIFNETFNQIIIEASIIIYLLTTSRLLEPTFYKWNYFCWFVNLAMNKYTHTILKSILRVGSRVWDVTRQSISLWHKDFKMVQKYNLNCE